MPEENNVKKFKKPLQTIHLKNPEFIYNKIFNDLVIKDT